MKRYIILSLLALTTAGTMSSQAVMTTEQCKNIREHIGYDALTKEIAQAEDYKTTQDFKTRFTPGQKFAYEKRLQAVKNQLETLRTTLPESCRR